MDYRQTYIKIIKKAVSENRVLLKRFDPNYVYYELHHILPRSLFPKWVKKCSNLVLLTPREHFFCHILLTYVFPSKEMDLALWFMSDLKTYPNKLSTRGYERIRDRGIKALRKIKETCHTTEKAINNHKIAAFKTNNLSKGTAVAREVVLNRSKDPILKEEHRKKIAAKIGKKIMCIETGIVYDSKHYVDTRIQSHIARYVDKKADPKGRHWITI